MANADGSVIFSCDLDSTKAQKKLSKLRDEISELNSKLEKETVNKINLDETILCLCSLLKAFCCHIRMRNTCRAGCYCQKFCLRTFSFTGICQTFINIALLVISLIHDFKKFIHRFGIQQICCKLLIHQKN